VLQPDDYLEADLGDRAVAFFTTRRGGVSSGPWAGLNLSPSSGDAPEAVAHNRQAVAATIGARLVGMHQVHGNTVATVDSAALAGSAPSADALITRDPEVGLTVLVADCVPILLVEPHARIVAAIHAGRRGVSEGIVPETIAELEKLGGRARAVRAAIGPAICGACYEVPAAMRAEVAREMPGCASETSWGTPALDLPRGVTQQLKTAGVQQVHNLDVCTFEDLQTYSYRRSPNTGRSAGVIRLK